MRTPGRSQPRFQRTALAGPVCLLILLPILACGGSLLLDQAHVDEVRALIDDGRYVEAETRASELLDDSRPGEGANALARAEMMALHASAWRRADPSKRAEAKAEAGEALALKIELAGEKHPSVARSWDDMGLFHELMAEGDEARKAYRRALEIGREALGPEDSFLSLPLIHLASMAYFGEADLPRALSLLEEARLIQEKTLPAEHPDVATRLLTLGLIRQDTGDYEAAHDCLCQSLAIREKSQRPDHPFIASDHKWLGRLLARLGDFPGARRHNERALEIELANHGPDHLFYSHALAGLASLYEGMGDLNRAEQLFRQALEIDTKNLGESDPQVLETTRRLAIVLRDRGDYEAAGELFAQVLEHLTGDDRVMIESRVQLHNRYGSVLFLLGRKDEAEASIRRSLRLAEENLGPDHPYTRTALLNLASLLFALGEVEESDWLFRQALSGYEEIPGSNVAYRLIGLTEHAMVLAALGRHEEALRSALLAQSLAMDHLQRNAGFLESSLALKFAASSVAGLHTAVAITTAGQTHIPQVEVERAAEAIVRSRALVLDELATRARFVQETSDPAIADRHRNLQAASLRLADLTAGGAATDSADLAEAAKAKELAERRLAEASQGFRRQRQPLVGLERIRASLPADSALVAYHRFFDYSLSRYGEDDGRCDSYLALVLAGRDEPARIIDIGTAEEIDRLVLDWREELVNGIVADIPDLGLDDTYRQAGIALREKIWDSLRPHLGEASTVFLVPDSDLHLVSFAALPSGGERYLVEEGPAIHYLSAERELAVWADDEPIESTATDLLLIGDPDFGTADDQDSNEPENRPDANELLIRYAGLQFSQLPGTAEEIRRVEALMAARDDDSAAEPPTVLTLTGEQATEAAFKKRAPGCRMLHLATHAFFIEPEDREGDVAREPQRIQTGLRAFNLARPDENPLLRAGLALAGANRRGAAGESGILTAEEIVSLDLGRVELAVLSACDTGLGTVQSGEGVFGLRRAFRLAGVDTVINSLWPVEDVTTSQWMGEFYRSRFKDRQPIVEAVRRANLDILHRRREAGLSSHPFFWAAFVAAGNWR